MDSLAESGRVEYNADIIILLDPVKGDDTRLTARVVKNRHGPKGRFELLFLKQFSYFEEVAETPPAKLTKPTNGNWKKIHALLPGGQGPGVTRKDLEEKTGIPPKEINALLKEYRLKGVIEAMDKDGNVLPPTESGAGKTLTYRRKEPPT